jgi:hypothetical protein
MMVDFRHSPKHLPAGVQTCRTRVLYVDKQISVWKEIGAVQHSFLWVARQIERIWEKL